MHFIKFSAKILFIFLFFAQAGALFAHNFLFSIPRSGSHFFIYGLCYLTLEPFSNGDLFSEGKNLDMISPITNPFNLEIDSTLPPLLIRTHSSGQIKKLYSKGDKLIFIIRDPLEVILAAKKMSGSNDNRITKEDMSDFLSYVQFFESWDEENRLIICYEDLVTNPERVFSNALVFLNRKDDRLEHFIDNIDSYKEISMQKYSNHFPNNPAQSNCNLKWHQFDLDSCQQVKRECFQYFSNHDSGLYRRYLARYFES